MKANETLDAKGLACPMPIVKTKKAITGLEAGTVLEILATDQGSKADIQAWAENAGHQYLGTVEEGEVLKHYLRKGKEDEDQEEKKHDQTISNEELQNKLSEDVTVLDVREPAEYAFGHIPGAINIPLGELDERLSELNQDQEVYVVCRTGSRSDLASQKLANQGHNAYNVIPGMKEWSGETKQEQ